jgi:hypothetical protein
MGYISHPFFIFLLVCMFHTIHAKSYSSSINHDDHTIKCLIVMYTVRPGGSPPTFILDVM